jgi:hypothetical protein
MAVSSSVRLLVTDYDSTADVFSVSLGRARPTMGHTKDNGIVVRYALDDPKNACGVTIFQFQALGWASKLTQLSAAIADILSVEEDRVFAKIELRLRQAAKDAGKTEHAPDQDKLLSSRLTAAAQAVAS